MMAHRFVGRAIETGYWMPGDNYLELILGAIRDFVEDGDILVVSEKALSVAKGRIVDESLVSPSFLARFIAHFWMRVVWGCFLGAVCRLKPINVRRLREYPVREGSAHKQVALWYAGFLDSLLWGSEGGIDASNLPYSYVSLPLEYPEETAQEIHSFLRRTLSKHVAVMIVDTDKTYSFGRFHFTHRRKPMKGIRTFFGVFAYIIGRALNLKSRSTPLAVAGLLMDAELALELAEAAHRLRGSGLGRTVWDMAESLGVDLTGVTWEMLKSFRHKPIVVFRHCKEK
ncbi:MAG: coenzyme F420-0:L-glutamate ligase [Nitrososphaerota archaeon]|nr:coenzyme F420-0:L-glutamate ligase [Candidatus Bathyarchaeota archaeon]MDW8048162.1 coenzyme F420-0:L-glutamate ligase [Nitrososphaerota archaeon]